MIIILDYKMGNVGSILNMLKRIGKEDVKISNDIADIEKADKLILPGVGSFDTGINHLNEFNLIDTIYEHVLVKKKPILGICLGMQLLGRKSEEGSLGGLNLIPFDNIRFNIKDQPNLKVPHMGWNYVQIENKNNPLLKDIEEKQRYYFVHSYHAVCDSSEDVLLTCEYGYQFVAAVSRENIYGTQFHPEKSHMFGMKILTNFAKEC